MHTHVCHSTHVGVRGKCTGVSSLLQCASWESSSGPQVGGKYFYLLDLPGPVIHIQWCLFLILPPLCPEDSILKRRHTHHTLVTCWHLGNNCSWSQGLEREFRLPHWIFFFFYKDLLLCLFLKRTLGEAFWISAAHHLYKARSSAAGCLRCVLFPTGSHRTGTQSYTQWWCIQTLPSLGLSSFVHLLFSPISFSFQQLY